MIETAPTTLALLGPVTCRGCGDQVVWTGIAWVDADLALEVAGNDPLRFEDLRGGDLDCHYRPKGAADA